MCIPGLVNGTTASATRAPCGQSPYPLATLGCLARSNTNRTPLGTGLARTGTAKTRTTEVSRPFCGSIAGPRHFFLVRTYPPSVSPPLERILKKERRTFRQVGGGRSTTCRARFKTRNAFCSIRRDLNTGARRAPAAIWSSAVFNGPPRPAPPTLLVPPRVPRQSGMSLR